MAQFPKAKIFKSKIKELEIGRWLSFQRPRLLRVGRALLKYFILKLYILFGRLPYNDDQMSLNIWSAWLSRREYKEVN